MNISALVETLAKPGLLGVIGRRSERRLQQALATYFRILGQKVTALKLEQMTLHNDGMTRNAVGMRLYNTLRMLTPLLKATLETGLHQGMLDADKIHHFAESHLTEAEGDDEGFTIDDPLGDGTPMLSGDEAALYASIHAGEQVAGINNTTQELLADAVEQGIADNLGVDGTGRLIRQTLDDMSVARARMIASTEMNDAFSEAAIRKLDRLGIGWKQWITSSGNCCDECTENEDASPIPTSDMFPSGDSRPPAHPNCRCAVTGARAPQ